MYLKFVCISWINNNSRHVYIIVGLDLYIANVGFRGQVIQVVPNLAKYLHILLNVMEYNDFIIRYIVSFLRNGHNLTPEAKNNIFILVTIN